ncbi:MAG: prepilin-type N-terminal cleavage/methylation domain-containing protein [Phenylobacterium sp.]|nr:prepilin-type N-terminal cleavage/methylation domain-containing protein [Phenylobacterium sp.]
MNEAGYTLTEVLAAMAVIGMAAGGLSLSMQVLGAQQASVGGIVLKMQDVRAAEAWLTRRLAEHAPFRAQAAERLSGGAEGFRFDCDAAAPCSAELEADAGTTVLTLTGGHAVRRVRLPGDGQTVRFVYTGGGDLQTAWPPTDGGRRSLDSIALVQGEGPGASPILGVRIHVEQTLDCVFDAVLGDCR